MKDPQKGGGPIQLQANILPLYNMKMPVIAGKMSRHMTQYMSEARRRIGSNNRGAKHQLLIDKTVTQDCNQRKPCTSWINYKRAYITMPYKWILECLELYNIKRTLRTFIQNSMGLWKTNLEANSKPIAQVNIKCSIYQGDALTPLLFCIGLNPLSHIMTKSGHGYRFRSGATITHLLCMNDIKLYARTEQDLDSLILLTRLYKRTLGYHYN